MTTDEDRRYRAPALEKGLDILELLAASSSALTMAAMVQQLGRSYGELFRVVQVLEYRGFIEQDARSDGYVLTCSLFSLGMRQPQTRSLVECALPVMRALVEDSGQSCHLAFHTRGDMVVVARVEPADQLGFSVRVGYRRPLARTGSGVVLYAYQDDDVRQRWEAMMVPPLDDATLAAFRDRADAVRIAGSTMGDSEFVAGITDIAVPILRDGHAAAALAIPFVARLDVTVDQAGAIALLTAAAARLSAQLIAADGGG